MRWHPLLRRGLLAIAIGLIVWSALYIRSWIGFHQCEATTGDWCFLENIPRAFGIIYAPIAMLASFAIFSVTYWVWKSEKLIVTFFVCAVGGVVWVVLSTL